MAGEIGGASHKEMFQPAIDLQIPIAVIAKSLSWVHPYDLLVAVPRNVAQLQDDIITHAADLPHCALLQLQKFPKVCIQRPADDDVVVYFMGAGTWRFRRVRDIRSCSLKILVWDETSQAIEISSMAADTR